MKKAVYVDKKAKEVLESLPKIAQTVFYSQFRLLELEGRLDYPSAKKLIATYMRSELESEIPIALFTPMCRQNTL
ncbi:hypothetical protein ACFLZP_04810 [Patescibacteria group bacterium]